MEYTYRCNECEVLKNEHHGMSESPEIKCEQCDKKMVKVITGGGGFKLSGEGWHKGGFHTGGGGRTADLRDQLDEIKQQGKYDAQEDRDMSMPRSITE